MSADSTWKQHKPSGVIVRPQPVSDKTVIESVVDFIQDVVPGYATSPPKVDDREKVLWIQFQNVEVGSETCRNVDRANVPLLLVIGYENGVQCWTIQDSGEAYESFSLRQGPVRFAKILPSSVKGPFSSKQPLIIVCDSSSSNQEYCNLKLLSLKSGEMLNNISFPTQIVDLKCNDKVIAVSFIDKIIIYNTSSFKEKFTITSCYLSPGLCANPICLGDRWIAYADNKLVPMHQSCGGMAADGRQSYTSTMISAAKTISKGLSIFGETVATTLTGSSSSACSASSSSSAAGPSHLNQHQHHSNAAFTSHASNPPAASTNSAVGGPGGVGASGAGAGHNSSNASRHAPGSRSTSSSSSSSSQAGIVTIVDFTQVKHKTFKVSDDATDQGLVAHFPAHFAPVTSLTFDPSGTLLLTTDKHGHDLFLFRIMAHPKHCSLGAVHHLYTLHRGDTTAKVQDVCFTNDSRWIAVTTLHGTTHIFPITPYGGSVSVRTHTSPRVVNRSSKFQRSAGLEDLTSTSNSSSRRKGGLGGCGDSKNHIRITTTGLLNNNPRLPPFPHPTNIPTPLAQFKHGPIIPGITNVKRPSSNTAQSKINSNHSSESSCVSVCFASSRGHIAGKPNGPMGGGGGGVGGVGVAGEGVGGVGAGQLGLSAAAAAAGGCTAPPGCPRVDSLFVVSWSGILVEYVLTPTATTVNLSLLTNVTSSSNNNNGSDKVLDLLSSAKAQWPLIRNKNSAETHLPLHRHNALLQYFERLCSLSTPNSSDQATPPTPQAPPPTGLGCTAEVTMGVGAMQVGASLCNGSRESLASSENYDNDAWLSQVEIITYAGPHRRLWMGPQFSFRTYQQAAPTNRGRGSSGDIPHDSQDIDTTNKINTSSPVQMPNHGKFKQNDSRYIQSGSYDPHPIENIQSNSWQDTSHSMKLHDIASGNSSSSLPSNGSGGGGAGGVGGCEDETLCEHIAEAMLESPINRGGHIYGEAGITTQTINVDHYSNTPSSSYDSLNSQRLVDNDA